MQIQLLAFNWYPSEEEYNKILSVCEDRANLPDTFADWLKKAEEGLKHNQSIPGRKVIKIDMYASEITAWLGTTRNINARDRTAFCQHKLSLMIKSGEIKF